MKKTIEQVMEEQGITIATQEEWDAHDGEIVEPEGDEDDQ